MTKNKSLFSGVGDGNRVKSIRLQGDKHTQGKKGEEKNCECGQGRSNPRAPTKLPAGGWSQGWGRRGEAGQGGEGQGGAGAARMGESWGPDAKPTSLGSRPQRKPPRTGWLRRQLLHRTCARGQRS